MPCAFFLAEEEEEERDEEEREEEELLALLLLALLLVLDLLFLALSSERWLDMAFKLVAALVSPPLS